ncbi:uncharacterized protein E6C27_scaffold345G00330 [Cucumis melo var. makuwa]|uniref:Ubiquitin-like protease family profile domain-containing protein n=1 Tax=Cucumis melo var. makuwa TaxID=1194695 RepID=A0A5A7TFR7_CUCMM|nr:uncharacterized protein E6C27_scaffold345G00330 [Cucumis melo var. makuwa]
MGNFHNILPKIPNTIHITRAKIHQIISQVARPRSKLITPEVELCHKEEDDSRCESYKRSNRSRSSIGSINIDLDADEDMVNTPSKKGVEDPLVNIIAVATVVDDNIGCPNVKVLVDVVIGENLTILNPMKEKIETLNQALGNIIEWPCRLVSTINDKQEHSTMKDVVYSSNYTDVNGNIKLLHKHAVNNMKDVDMIHIPMNELIFGRNKFVCLAREDLLHYCGMVEIGYVFHWMLHAIDLRENCIYVLDSLWSKVNEDIHGVITVLKMWQAKHDLQRYQSTSKQKPVKFNTKSAYGQEEIDEIRTKWAVLYGSAEKCAGILGVGSCALQVFIIGLPWRAACVV